MRWLTISTNGHEFEQIRDSDGQGILEVLQSTEGNELDRTSANERNTITANYSTKPLFSFHYF